MVRQYLERARHLPLPLQGEGRLTLSEAKCETGWGKIATPPRRSLHSRRRSPCRAGESHVGGAKLLRGNENLILTVSPDSIGDLFGPLCRLLFAVGRSSEEPSAARSDRDTVHCVARHAVRCHDLLRHRAVWAIERSSVAHDSGAGARDTEPRHLQPCLSHPRSEQLRRGVSALHQGVCDGGQNQGGGSSRWQVAEKSLGGWPKSHSGMDGDV